MSKVQFSSTTYTTRKGPGEVPAKLFGLYDAGHRYSRNMHEIHYVIFAFAGQDGNIYYWIIPDFPGCKPREELFSLVNFVPTPDADFIDVLNQKPLVDLILNEKGYVIGVKQAPPDVSVDFPVPQTVELSIGELLDAIDNEYQLPRFVQLMVEKSLEYENSLPEKAEENGIGERETEQQPATVPFKRFVPSGTPSVPMEEEVIPDKQQPDSKKDSNKQASEEVPPVHNDEQNEKQEQGSNEGKQEVVGETEEVVIGEEDEENNGENNEEEPSVEKMREILKQHADDPRINDYVKRSGSTLDKAGENFIRILYSFYSRKSKDDSKE